MDVAGWVCVGIVVWFAVSCGIGLLIGAVIIRASVEQALLRAWEAEAMAFDRTRAGVLQQRTPWFVVREWRAGRQWSGPTSDLATPLGNR